MHINFFAGKATVAAVEIEITYQCNTTISFQKDIPIDTYIFSAISTTHNTISQKNKQTMQIDDHDRFYIGTTFSPILGRSFFGCDLKRTSFQCLET